MLIRCYKYGLNYNCDVSLRIKQYIGTDCFVLANFFSNQIVYYYVTGIYIIDDLIVSTIRAISSLVTHGPAGRQRPVWKSASLVPLT